MSGAELQGDDGEKLGRRWSEVTQLPLDRDGGGRPVLALDDAELRFATAADGRGEGLAALDLDCADPASVLARAKALSLAINGSTILACGIRFHLA
jgi:hypothetical protein